VKACYETYNRVFNSEALAAGLNLVEARAAHDGDERPVYVRVAEYGGNVYLDLCNETWQVIEITPNGWRLADDAPVRFRRTGGMLALPMPVTGGKVDDLRTFINVDDDDWRLVVAWLVAALRFRGPFPILALFATQGAGKSTAARLLRSLVDPNTAPLRCQPKDDQNLMISATNTWIVAYDNLSHVPPWLSDALCRLSTGGGYATRELYTNSDEVIFDAMRPILLNSIEEVAHRPDLLERCLAGQLPPIPDERRRAEAKIMTEFEAARPRILGALLDAVAGALRELPTTTLARSPRMADFALWATAAESALGWQPGSFMSAYDRNRQAANDLALEASPIATRLLEFLATAGEWSGTSSDLLAKLNEPFSDKRPPPHWPKNARALSGELRRLAPNLAAAGWSIDFGRKPGGKRTRVLSFQPCPKPADFASQSSPPSPAATNPYELNGNNGAGSRPEGDAKPTRGDAKPGNGDANTPRNVSYGDARDEGDAKSGLLSAPAERNGDEFEEGDL